MHFGAHSATLDSVRRWASIHGLYVDYWPYSVVVVGIRRTETKETGFLRVRTRDGRISKLQFCTFLIRLQAEAEFFSICSSSHSACDISIYLST